MPSERQIRIHLRRATVVVALAALLGTGGCANTSGPNFWNPGTMQQQQLRSLYSDPYPDTNAGPEVVGVRPRDFDNSLPEPVKNQPFRFLAPP